jgi:hypothetical protein
LWRLQGSSKIIAAALYRHIAGTELVVYFEPESAEDVLETRFSRFGVREPEERVEVLRGFLGRRGGRSWNSTPERGRPLAA